MLGITDYQSRIDKTLGKNRYTIIDVNKINNSVIVKLKCNTCGTEFDRYFKSLLNRPTVEKCPTCKEDNKSQNGINDTIEFLENKYGYNPYEFLSEYKGVSTKIKVKCKTCNDIFMVTPTNLKYNKGKYHFCPNCANKRTSESKIKDIHYIEEKILNLNSGYNPYEFLSEYKGTSKHITVRCKTCNDIFDVKPSNIITALKKNNGKYYCPTCNNMKRSKKSYEEKLYEINPNIKNIEPYISRRDKIKHECLRCHYIWEATPNNTLKGNGCPACARRYGSSKVEEEICSFLSSRKIDYELRNRKILPSKKEIDIYIPSCNIAIECDGEYWHSDKYKEKNYHLDKTKECNELGIQLIHIFDTEWKHKQNILEDKILTLCNKTNDFDKIYARQCYIKEISNKTKDAFLNKNHIQGKDISSIRLGLFCRFYYEDTECEKSELLAVMTFCKPRRALGHTSKTEYDYELSRFAVKGKHIVVGGFSKLLKYFERNYDWNKIITYADKRYSLGNVYLKNNFSLLRISKPNYWYYDNGKDILYHRYNFRKSQLKYYFPNIYSDNKTEFEIMNSVKNYDRIYDCGNYVFEYIKK